MLQRPLTALLTVAAVALCTAALVPVAGATLGPVPLPAAAPAQTTVSARPPASIKVTSCQSNAYYAGREFSVRTKMMWQDLSVPQKLRLKIEVWRRLFGAHRYRKLNLPGLKAWTSPNDRVTSLYKHLWTIDDIETAATYRAKATFVWKDPTSGKVQARRTTYSKPCKQRVGLPRLSIEHVTSAQSTGMSGVDHQVSVVNKGKSEAQDVPVAVYVDSADPVFGKIDSIGPGQVSDLSIKAPECKTSAYAVIDPLRSLARLKGPMRIQFPIQRCS